jgi:uncharacterized membrane protein YphA (DoxX/SURF4 family)
MRAVGFPPSKLWLLACAEILGIVGLIVGLLWWPAGVLASIGLIGYFIGALVYLLRARVTVVQPLASAGAFLLLAVAALFLHWPSS